MYIVAELGRSYWFLMMRVRRKFMRLLIFVVVTQILKKKLSSYTLRISAFYTV
jgi:hypothetical protein